MSENKKKVLKEAVSLLWQDIRDSKAIIIAISVYFAIVWIFFHTSCSLVLFTGYPCPACGMTRAGRSLLRGDVLSAWKLHPFIYLVALLAIVAGVKRYIRKQSLQSLKKWAITLILAACVFYVYRMYRYFPGEPPISYYSGNVLRSIFSLYIPR